MLYILLAIMIVILLSAYFTYVFTFKARPDRARDPFILPDREEYTKDQKFMHDLIHEMNEVPFERVYTKSFDGLILTGRYIHVKDGAPVQLQCHGYRGNPVRDFCGGNKLARETGHNSLVIEQRAHLDSGGNVISFGVNERRDVLSWIEYLVERFGNDVQIVLSGVSMGAATVLMAGEYNHKNVKCIVADCPFSSPHAIIKRVSGEMGIPSFIAMPLEHLGALLFGRFRLGAASAVEAVKKTSHPILLIHGEADSFVPCDMSREIKDACASEVRFETFPDAGHALSFIKDFDRYKRICQEFFLQHLK
ncbi:MAG: prolyl oligopeptidase family serine peptidase [Clostridia bacterium]|nr:prolyl oligopeptidase family serine peptidase [Clostridia bacterium]